MNTIHGISFIDYAATRAWLVKGKHLDELLLFLTIDIDMWHEACNYWEQEILSDRENKLLPFFDIISQDPAQGKFDVLQIPLPEELIVLIPTLEKYIELEEMVSVALAYELDIQMLLKEQGLTTRDFRHLHIYWIRYQNELISPSSKDYETYLQWFSNVHEIYRFHFEELFTIRFFSDKDQVIF